MADLVFAVHRNNADRTKQIDLVKNRFGELIVGMTPAGAAGHILFGSPGGMRRLVAEQDSEAALISALLGFTDEETAVVEAAWRLGGMEAVRRIIRVELP